MESDLVCRAQKGDQLAFRELVEQYAGVTERTAYVLMKGCSRPEVEDAVQEAWVDAWRGLTRFDPARPFRPWLLTILANRCRMSTRKKVPSTVPYGGDLNGSQEGPTSQVVQQPFIVGQSHDEELERALSTLEEQHRQILALRFYADLSLEEIAEATGTPLGTVKSRLHRALTKLRDWLSNAQSRLSHTHHEKEVMP